MPSLSFNCRDRACERLHNDVGMLLRERQWRGDDEGVGEVTDQHALFHAALPDLRAKSQSEVERLLGLLVGDQFNPDHQSHAPDIADVAVARLQLFQPVEEIFADFPGVGRQVFLLDDTQVGERRRAGQRMASIGVTMHEGARREFIVVVGIERRRHARVDHGSSQRHVAAVDALCEHHDVRLDPVGAATEHGAGASKAGHHLIGDHEHAVPVADLAHQRPEIRRRDDDATGALYRLGNEGCDGVRSLIDDLPLQEFGANTAEFQRIAGKGIAIEVGRLDLEKALQQGFVLFPIGRLAVQRERAERHAVIGLLQRNEFGASGLLRQPPELPRQFDRRLDRLGAARGIKYPLHAFRRRQPAQQFGKFDHRHGRGVAEHRIEAQLVELLNDGPLDLGPAVTGIDVP